MSQTAFFFSAVFLLVYGLQAHPGSGIAVDGRKHVFFTDTGKGIWEAVPGGAVRLVSTSALHWLAATTSFDDRLPPPGRWFEHVGPEGSDLVLVLCSDFPCAVAPDGSVVYADTRPPARIVRRTASGREETIAGGATDSERAGSTVFRSITGIAVSRDGAVLLMDVDPDSNAHALRVVTARGEVTTVASDFVPFTSHGEDQIVNGSVCRGLACDASGMIYVAATGVRSVVALDHNRQVRTILRCDAPWSPTAVSTEGENVYVLEYTDPPPGADVSDRTVWAPRVRKVQPDGRVSTIVEIRR